MIHKLMQKESPATHLIKFIDQWETIFEYCWYIQVSQVQTIVVYVDNAPKNYIALPLVDRYHLMTCQLTVGHLW